MFGANLLGAEPSGYEAARATWSSTQSPAVATTEPRGMFSLLQEAQPHSV